MTEMMKSKLRAKYVILSVFLLICVAAFIYCVKEICYGKFYAHVWLCTQFPKLAKYSELLPVNDKSIDLILHKDAYAYKKFTESFSEPIRIATIDTNGFKYLRRIWDVDGGYLVLMTGRDPRDYQISISFTKGNWMYDSTLEQASGIKEVTKSFLNDYHVILTPIDRANNRQGQ